jgi:hypothetical protein
MYVVRTFGKKWNRQGSCGQKDEELKSVMMIMDEREGV